MTRASKGRKVDVSVSIGDKHIAKIGKVKKDLEAAGLQVQDVLEAAGVITGKAAESALAQLEGVAGVTAVERTRSYQLPPPDAEIQ